jgi:hypothetical protein
VSTATKRGGKELADLLVVCGDDIVVFSDKSCAFPDTGNLSVNWSRWHRKAVMGAAEQAWGAERWIKKHPNRLFLDTKCTQRFPITLPPPSRARFHRVVVSHNVAEPCRKWLGGSGSLMFRAEIGASPDHPFTIGDLDSRRGFVHVLDDAALEIVLGNLDTVSDFVAYLHAKEEFARSGALGMSAGEEELLAVYLTHCTNDAHHFPVSNRGAKLFVDEGHWKQFQGSPERQAQNRANEISYTWDQLIATLERHALDGTLEFSSHDELQEIEPVLRILAAEDRTLRRHLSEELIGLLKAPIAPERPFNARVIASRESRNPAYVFVSLGEHVADSREEYRRKRQQLAASYALAAHHCFPHTECVVVIATEPLTDPDAERSEDLLLLRKDRCTPAMQTEGRRLYEEVGLLKTTQAYASTVSEYPIPFGSARMRHAEHGTAATDPVSRRDRNKP